MRELISLMHPTNECLLLPLDGSSPFAVPVQLPVAARVRLREGVDVVGRRWIKSPKRGTSEVTAAEAEISTGRY